MTFLLVLVVLLSYSWPYGFIGSGCTAPLGTSSSWWVRAVVVMAIRCAAMDFQKCVRALKCGLHL